MKKYLSRYAEPEIALTGVIRERYSDAIVIPVCNEDPTILDAWTALDLPDGKALVLVVVNENAGAHPETSRANAEFLAQVERRRPRAFGAAFWLPGKSDVLVLDRARGGRALAAREGVGRARKIGCDVAAALHASLALESAWIHTSDADARIDASRFRLVRETASAHASLAAITLPFRHEREESDASRAAVFYEIELRYLVAGLRFARSPYAFHSIGSTLAIHAHSYAKVRGFPNRRAGEDFHILDKLAKTGTIAQPCGAAVVLEARHSDRVPFGTGPALRRITAALARQETPSMFAPECFQALARWIRALDRFAEHARLPLFQSEAGEAEADSLLGASRAFAHLARRNEPGSILRRHLHTWFDGLRTIRFLHCVRDRKFGKKPWHEAMRDAPFVRGPKNENAEQALERLRALEQQMFFSGLGVSAER